MKKIILLALAWPLCSYPIYAQKEQKEKLKDNGREIIIIKSNDKDKKITIETKNGEVYINGKKSSDYKDDDVSVIRQKFRGDRNFLYAPQANARVFEKKWNAERRAFLGVTTEKTDDGVKITDISSGSAAEKAGLKEGDVITKVGDKKITDPDDLMDAISDRKPKEDVAISYKRNGKTSDVKATLGETGYSRSFSFNNNDDGNFVFHMPKIAATPIQPYAYSFAFGGGRLGMRIEDTDNNSGAKVIDVDDESPAGKAGLKEGDIITEVNGKKIKDISEARKEIAEVKDKTSYNIKAKRNGADMNFEIKIPKRLNRADL